MLKRWRRLTSRILRENPWWTYKLDTFEIEGGVRGEYHYVHTEGSSMVIPVSGDGRVLLVNQYRYLGERESLELPCGSVKKGHTPLQTARLELAEETGWSAGSFLEVGAFHPYNGIASETCKVFVARDLEPSEALPDETEEFELVRASPEDVDAKIRNGEIWDGMTLAAWMLARARALV